MTLDEAIKHAQEKADNSTCGCEHQQLADWLTELKQIKQQRDELLAALSAYPTHGEYFLEHLDATCLRNNALAKVGADNAGCLP